MKTAICPSGKKVYTSESLALDALIEANVQFDFGQRTGPISFYKCEDCGEFHLTSKGRMNDRLEAMIKDGSLNKMKRAAAWENKFRKL